MARYELCLDCGKSFNVLTAKSLLKCPKCEIEEEKQYNEKMKDTDYRKNAPKYNSDYDYPFDDFEDSNDFIEYSLYGKLYGQEDEEI